MCWCCLQSDSYRACTWQDIGKLHFKVTLAHHKFAECAGAACSQTVTWRAPGKIQVNFTLHFTIMCLCWCRQLPDSKKVCTWQETGQLHFAVMSLCWCCPLPGSYRVCTWQDTGQLHFAVMCLCWCCLPPVTLTGHAFGKKQVNFTLHSLQTCVWGGAAHRKTVTGNAPGQL